MLIQPGADGPSVRDFVELVKTGSKRRIDVTLLDTSGNPINISEVTLPSGLPDGELDLTVESLGGTEVYQENYWPNPVVSSRRIVHDSDGHYYLTLGDVASETASSGTYVASWHARQNATSEDEYRTQVLQLVSTRTLTLFPRLRLFLDKSLKVVVPSEYCFVGYTDAQLLLYLMSGLSYLNDFEPYPMWLNLDDFPVEYHADLLIKAAAYTAIQSQTLFATDTDINQYSSASHSFSINHFQPLSAFASQLKTELDQRVRPMKLKYVNSGTCKVQLQPNMAFASLLSAAPWGANFRGLWTAR